MKELNFQPAFLQKLYLVFYIILAALIILTPILISGAVHFSEKFILDEEIIEVFLLGVLFSLSLFIFKLYKQEVHNHKELVAKINNDKKSTEVRLFESLDYIGKVNVQIEEIKSIFSTADKYPETKNDFKKSFRFLSERVLGIVNTNWVLLRIIDTNTRKTISECFETRQGIPCNYPHVSNKKVIENQPHVPYTTVITSPKNLSVAVCCHLPIDKINSDQRIFIQAIINEITMLFIILNSSYYKNENNIVVGKK